MARELFTFHHDQNYPAPVFITTGPGYFTVRTPDEYARMLLERVAMHDFRGMHEYINARDWVKLPGNQHLMEIAPRILNMHKDDEPWTPPVLSRKNHGKMVKDPIPDVVRFEFVYGADSIVMECDHEPLVLEAWL